MSLRQLSRATSRVLFFVVIAALLWSGSPKTVWADGINSATNEDLPIGAGGHSVMILKPTGEVGIGTETPASKLDVVGGVKMDNDTGACTTAKAGTIRWTGTAFEGCDGSAWGSLGGSGEALPGTLCGDWGPVGNGNLASAVSCNHLPIGQCPSGWIARTFLSRGMGGKGSNLEEHHCVKL